MTETEYWMRELEKAADLAPAANPQIMAALLIAHQLLELHSTLGEINSRLAIIEEHLE